LRFSNSLLNCSLSLCFSLSFFFFFFFLLFFFFFFSFSIFGLRSTIGIECLAEIFHQKGIEVASQVGDVYQLFTKLLKSTSTHASVRAITYRTIGVVFRACGPSASFLHDQLVRTLSKYLPSERFPFVRSAGARALAVLCEHMGPWAHELAEHLVRLSVRLLHFCEAPTRDAAGAALGYAVLRRITERVTAVQQSPSSSRR
jgi:hypothetical protein